MKYLPKINLSADPRQIDPPEIISFSRNCRAYSIGSDGYLHYAEENQLRHEFDPVTREYLGWLIEGPATNEVPFSTNLAKRNDIGELYWNFENKILTASNSYYNNPIDKEKFVEIVPAGTATYAPNKTHQAFKFRDVESDTAYRRVIWYPTMVLRSNYVVFSIYAKAAEYNALNIEVGTWSGKNIIATFDLENSRVESISGSKNLKEVDIEPMVDGWFRLIIRYDTETGPSFATRPYVRLMLLSDVSNYGELYAGQPGQGLYLWGPQLEYGKVESSYIESLDKEAGVRLGDDMSFNSLKWFNLNEGTFFFESAVRKKITAVHRLLNLFNLNPDVGSNEYYTFCTALIEPQRNMVFSVYDPAYGTINYTLPAGNYTRAHIVCNTTLQTPDEIPQDIYITNYTNFWNLYYENQQVVPDQFYKMALSYKPNGVKYFLDGNATIEDNYNTLPLKINYSTIGSGMKPVGSDYGTEYLNGYIRRLVYYDSKLPDDYITELTL